MKKSGPFFTEKARAAAAAARRRRAAEARANKDHDNLIVFATRNAENADGGKFGWEIRQFGGIVIKRSTESFNSPTLARQAGGAALTEVVAAD